MTGDLGRQLAGQADLGAEPSSNARLAVVRHADPSITVRVRGLLCSIINTGAGVA